jgi:sporulation protein YlmC with PRC-barrel domain
MVKALWIAGLTSLAISTGVVYGQQYGYGQEPQSQTQGTTQSGNQGSYRTQGSYGSQGGAYGSQSGQSGSYGNPGSSSGNQEYGQGNEGYGTQQQYGNPSYGNQQQYGQNYGSQRGSQSYESSQQSFSQGRFCDAKHLLGQEVNDEQGQEIGHIKDIVFNPQNGEVFAAVGIGNGRTTLVPAQALKIRGSQNNLQVSVNTTKQTLQSAPAFSSNQWLQTLNRNPNLTQRLYSHFNVTSQSSMGGSSGSNMGGSSTGTWGGNSSQSQGGSYGSQGGASYGSQGGGSGGSGNGQ